MAAPAMVPVNQTSSAMPFFYGQTRQYGYANVHQDEATALMHERSQESNSPPPIPPRPIPERPRVVPPTKHTRLAIPPIRPVGSAGRQSAHSDGATTFSEYYQGDAEEPPLYTMGQR